MHRLFVGLRPPPPMREALLSLAGGIVGARWQTEDQLHCTLRFIGEVERPLAEDIALALEGIRAPVLALALHGVGSFGTRGRSRAVWAGLTPHDGLHQLHKKVDQALARAGVPHDSRAYHPHVTLARLGGAAGPVDRFLADHAGLSGPAMPFDAFLLYESTLGREGATYEAVARYPLR